MLHLLLDLEEGDMQAIQSIERTVEEERIVALEMRGLVDVKVTAEGRKALREHYLAKDAEP
jgi:hypothetical protein